MSEIMKFQLILMLLFMLFFHIIDDFVCQGKLALFKQKDWWKENYPKKKYKYDFIICLFLHAFEWSFWIHVPITIYALGYQKMNVTLFVWSVIINTCIHANIDHIKANLGKFNLTQDQLLHIGQIIITWTVFVIFVFL